MKTKRFEKKLALKKKTVANLNDELLYQVKGGILTVGYTCRTCVQSCFCNITKDTCQIDCTGTMCTCD
jgi:hypothetical protein